MQFGIFSVSDITRNPVTGHTPSEAERIDAIVQIAGLVVDGSLRLEPGSDVDATHRTLVSVDGVTGRLATAIVARALQWPDAFPASDARAARLLRR